MILKKYFLRAFHTLGRHPEKLTPKKVLFETLNALRPRAFADHLVRIGGVGDGGYLLPESVRTIEVVVSPGVGDSVKFELDMLNKFGSHSVLIDASVERDSEWPEEFFFLPKYLGARSDKYFMNLEEVITHCQLSQKKLLLQMDIEGFEYEVLMTTPSKTLRLFEVIVIELHDLNLWIRKEIFVRFIKPALENLLEGFVPIHFHPNNAGGFSNIYGLNVPNTVELTLVRKVNQKVLGEYSILPHPLD